MNARAELARKVARMWEEQLKDARETADAWRRVLRMKPGDTEATQGLERAKANMLKKADPGASDAYAPPVFAASGSVPAAALAKEPAATTGEEPATLDAKPSSTMETATRSGESPRAKQSPSDPPTQSRPLDESGSIPSATTSNPLPFPAPPPSAPRSERPKDLWFRASQDEITMSALSSATGGNEPTLDQKVEPPQLTPSDGVYTSVNKERFPSPTATKRTPLDEEPSSPEGSEADLSRTSEQPVFDDSMLEATNARPQGIEERQALHEAPDVITSTSIDARPLRASASGGHKRINPDGSEEFIMADDLVDLIEIVDEAEQGLDTHTAEASAMETDPTDQGEKPPTPSQTPRSTRSTPPPLPKL
jgi:hypothetical protein